MIANNNSLLKFEIGDPSVNKKLNSRRASAVKPIKATADILSPRELGSLGARKQTIDPVSQSASKVQPKGARFGSKDKQVSPSPKVLETWINDTLKDAEHLDIPGIILKPEH